LKEALQQRQETLHRNACNQDSNNVTDPTTKEKQKDHQVFSSILMAFRKHPRQHQH